MEARTPPSVILIGGSSHAGKSSAAAALAARLDRPVLSTDSLARHPGRPWRPGGEAPPPHVAEHYGALAPEELIASVLDHYRNMWPMVRALIERHVHEPALGPLVLEGSALWPPSVAELDLASVGAVWITASGELFSSRIRRESDYARRDAEGRRLIDSFLARTEIYDARMMKAVRRLGLPFVEAKSGEAVQALADRCLRRIMDARA